MLREEITGEVMATGRTSEILSYGDGKVLKLFKAGIDPTEIAQEVAHSTEAHALGATPIACHGMGAHCDTPGIVFDALTGGSLTEMAERNLFKLRESGRILARCHCQLHQIESDLFPDVRETLTSLLERAPMAFLSPRQKTKARDIIAGLPDGSAILHMDFHTNNVFAHQDGYATIDWQTTLRGTPAADVAMTLFLLADAELWPGVTFAQKLLYNTVRRILRQAYLTEYKAISGISQAELDAWRLPALIIRLAEWDIASEGPRLRAEITRLLKD
nr:aminoglycoside phosphotransferase family protein [uncultured Celeribacter sp.]